MKQLFLFYCYNSNNSTNNYYYYHYYYYYYYYCYYYYYYYYDLLVLLLLEVLQNDSKRLQNREGSILFFTFTSGYHMSTLRLVHKCSCVH